jgi:anti-sigma regulatory factor (Ser/Thr protein kinase)
MNTHLLESEDVAWFRDELTAARGVAAALARRVGLDEQRAAEVALCVSEAAGNLTKHAVDGSVLLRVVRSAQVAGVEVLTIDSGPGMADVAQSLRDGSSSTGTLGIGLGALARLADSLDIHSLPGRGTVMAARFWNRGTARGFATEEPVVAGLTRAINGEQVCGDAWAARLDSGGERVATATVRPSTAAGFGWAALTAAADGGSTRAAPVTARSPEDSAVLVMLCDGLGHGPLAALAGTAAVQAFRDGSARTPEEAIQEIHRALRGTRGAAVAVARIEPAAGRLLYCGVGNVSGVLLGPHSRAGLMSHPGIVGHQLRGLRTFEQPLPPGGALVMHSDGLTDRWSIDTLPGLLLHTPLVAAGQLLRTAGIRHDDAGVVVAKDLW